MAVIIIFFAGGVLCGCVLLAAGFISGFWCANKGSATPNHTGFTDMPDAPEASALQRARILSSSLMRLIQGVAADVTAHSSKIEGISADLRAVEESLPEAQMLLETATTRMLALKLALQ